MDSSDLCNACGHVHGVGTTCPICGHIRNEKSNNVMYQPRRTTSSDLGRVGNILGQMEGMPQLANLNASSTQPVIPEDSFQRMRADYFADIPNMSLDTLKRRCDELFLSMTEAQRAARYPLIIQAYRNEEFPLFPFNPDPKHPYGGINALYFSEYWRRGGEEHKPSLMFDMLIDERAFKATPRNTRQYYETLYKILMAPIVGGKRKTRMRKTKRTKRRTIRKTKRTKMRK